MAKLARTLTALLLAALVFAPARADQPLGELAYPNLGVLKQQLRDYVKSGRYLADIKVVTDSARAYLDAALANPEPGRPAMTLDIDETCLSNWEEIDRADFGYRPAEWDRWILAARATPIPPSLELYQHARAHGVSVFFITLRGEQEREPTERNLRQAGYDGWQELDMFAGGPQPPSAADYKSAMRKRIHSQGYRIVVNMGDQRSDLEGGYADGQFKLPNPMYYIP